MTDYHLQLAVFRLNDLCVGVQEGMEAFLTTAHLEKKPGVEPTFGWLRKRGVRICLLSDYDRSHTLILLQRLGWLVDENGTVQEIITEQEKQINPVLLAIEHAGLRDPNLSFTVFDTPRLLSLSNQARVHFNLAVCNGKHSYNELATSPHHAMLDSLVQLPNFVLQHLPEVNSGAGTRSAAESRTQPGRVPGQSGKSPLNVSLPRLRLPRPLSRR